MFPMTAYSPLELSGDFLATIVTNKETLILDTIIDFHSPRSYSLHVRANVFSKVVFSLSTDLQALDSWILYT